jgi:hypothetical protein
MHVSCVEKIVLFYIETTLLNIFLKLLLSNLLKREAICGIEKQFAKPILKLVDLTQRNIIKKAFLEKKACNFCIYVLMNSSEY